MEISYEKSSINLQNFFLVSMVKRGNFNKAPEGCIFRIYRYWHTDHLIEVKFDFVSEHFLDNSDKFAGTVPKGIVVSLAFHHFGIIISFEGLLFF